MKVVIEFHRVRADDDALAKIGRVSCDVIDAEAAIGLAASLAISLAMPQEPDIVTISDDQGNAFYRAKVGFGHDARADHEAFEIGVWENEGGAVAPHSYQGRLGSEARFLIPNTNEEFGL